MFSTWFVAPPTRLNVPRQGSRVAGSSTVASANKPLHDEILHLPDLSILHFPQDPFGNYVVQYVLELGDASASGLVMRGLAGHWPDLAQQKFSSNVVEKCLKLPGLAATQVCCLSLEFNLWIIRILLESLGPLA